jgi:DNA polymerase-3 subunit delta
VQRIGARRLTEALAECARIDRQIKGVEQGEAWHSLKRLAASLAAR